MSESSETSASIIMSESPNTAASEIIKRVSGLTWEQYEVLSNVRRLPNFGSDSVWVISWIHGSPYPGYNLDAAVLECLRPASPVVVTYANDKIAFDHNEVHISDIPLMWLSSLARMAVEMVWFYRHHPPGKDGNMIFFGLDCNWQELYNKVGIY